VRPESNSIHGFLSMRRSSSHFGSPTESKDNPCLGLIYAQPTARWALRKPLPSKKLIQVVSSTGARLSINRRRIIRVAAADRVCYRAKILTWRETELNLNMLQKLKNLIVGRLQAVTWLLRLARSRHPCEFSAVLFVGFSRRPADFARRFIFRLERA
jgi:hypothetical protein